MAKPSWIGKKLGGRYEIEALLGQGGMSAVYKANDPNLRRVVAVKLIHPHLSSNEQFIRRFEEEAAAVAQLRHPNIIQVHDYNHDDDTYYIVFEFLPGESLQDRLSRLADSEKKMPYSEVVKISSDVASALSYAHDRGLVHRDVKPANVMINFHGNAILMDFGIVKITGGTQHTATGAVIGTARYMSPEQIMGETTDARSDIYSLGIMLFEMVGGRAPFQADSVMTLMMMQINDPVPNLQALRPGVPPDLVRIIARTLAKKREDRYQSAADLLKDLRQANLSSTTASATMVEPVSPLAAGPETVLEDMLDAPPTRADDAPSQALPQTVLEEAAVVPPAGAAPRAEPPPTPAAPRREAGPAPVAGPAGAGLTGWLMANRRNQLIAGGLVLVLLLILAGVGNAFFGGPPAGDGGNGDGATPPIVAEVTEEGAIIALGDDTPTPTEPAEVVPAPSNTPPPPTDTAEPPTPTTQPTNTPPPTATPTWTPEPTNTPPPPTPTQAGPSVQITSIAIDGGNYVIAYQTFGYTPQLPGTHIHFFFNTVSQEQAGSPGSGPWKLYGGPSPFTGWTVAEKPAAATQMCSLVANPDHSIIRNTGNCVNLP